MSPFERWLSHRDSLGHVTPPTETAWPDLGPNGREAAWAMFHELAAEKARLTDSDVSREAWAEDQAWACEAVGYTIVDDAGPDLYELDELVRLDELRRNDLVEAIRTTRAAVLLSRTGERTLARRVARRADALNARLITRWGLEL